VKLTVPNEMRREVKANQRVEYLLIFVLPWQSVVMHNRY